MEDTWDRRKWRLVKDPRLERVIEAAGDNHGLPREELDFADTAADVLVVRRRVVGASEHAHYPASLVQVP
jgi:hypothetical protein